MSDTIKEMEGQLQELEELKTTLLEMIRCEREKEQKEEINTAQLKQANILNSNGWVLKNWNSPDPNEEIILLKNGQTIGNWNVNSSTKNDVYNHMGLNRSLFNYRVLTLLSRI